MELVIEPLSQSNKLDALQLVLDADVGPRTRTMRFFNQSLRRNRNNIFLGVHNGKVVGIIGWYLDNGTWAGKSLGSLFPYGEKVYWVSYFAVSERLRGRGIGTKLMQRLLSEMKEKNARELWTYTRRAKLFYEKMGFTFIKRAIIEHGYHDFLKIKFRKN